MDTKVYEFEIPNGYTVVSRSNVIPLETARELLTSNTRKRVDKLVKDNDYDDINVSKPVVICPHCGKSAIPPFVRIVTKEEIRTFLSEQTSLFNILEVNKANGSPLYCPNCLHQLSTPATRMTTVRITADKEYEQVVLTVYLPSNDWSQTTFDFKTGTVEFKNKHSNFPIITHDCCCSFYDWECSESFLALDQSYLVRRKLHQAFRFVLGNKLTFSGTDFTPVNAMLETLFRGYSADFYKALPVTLHGFDEGFTEDIKHMHSPSELASYYQGLPDHDAIRKLILEESPWMLLFKEEIIMLSDVLRDTTLLMKLLKWELSERLLNHLKTYSLHDFLSNFVQIASADELVNMVIGGRFEIFLRMSVHYSALTKSARKKEWRNWINRDFHDGYVDQIVLKKPLPRYFVIDGFEFIIPDSYSDYCLAEYHLQTDLDSHSTPRISETILIRKFGYYVGSLEVVHNGILMNAAGRKYSAIVSKPLNRAINKYKVIFELLDLRSEADEEEFDFFENEDDE